MYSATLTLDPAFVVGPVRRRTFGSFVEHLGRCVYTGIHDPGHPTADADGFRGDVLDLTRELGVTTVRYPGGNFVSGYRWEDGVGPVGRAPHAPGPRVALERPEPRRRRRVHAVGGQGRRRAHDGREPRDPRCAGGARPARVLQRARRVRVVRPSSGQRRRGAVPHQDVVPRQRDGRAVADRPQDGARVRASGGRDRARHAPHGPGPRARRVRLVELRHADLRGVGAGRAHRDVRARRPRLGPRVLLGGGRRPRVLPRVRGGHGPLRRVGRRDRGRRPGGGQAREAHPHLVRRVERLVPEACRVAAAVGRRLARGPGPARGPLQRRRRGRRREPAHLAPAAHRPGPRGVAGPARQRHRADHDRARWTVVASDDVPPVRAHGPARGGRRAAGRGGVARRGDRAVRRRARARRGRDARPWHGGRRRVRRQPLDDDPGRPRRRPARLPGAAPAGRAHAVQPRPHVAGHGRRRHERGARAQHVGQGGRRPCPSGAPPVSWSVLRLGRA